MDTLHAVKHLTLRSCMLQQTFKLRVLCVSEQTAITISPYRINLIFFYNGGVFTARYALNLTSLTLIFERLTRRTVYVMCRVHCSVQ